MSYPAILEIVSQVELYPACLNMATMKKMAELVLFCCVSWWGDEIEIF
jgi:hypothetical protein